MWTCGTCFTGYRLVLDKGCWIPMTEPSPLEMIFREIETAVSSGFYYLAIAVCLSVPDICAALLCDPKAIWVTEKKYTAWCKANLEPRFEHFTAEDCYRLRCGVLHQGNFGHPRARYDRILFNIAGGITVHDARIKDGKGGEVVLTLDCATFCRTMISAAREWLLSMASNTNVQSNLPNIVRLRPAGIPPFAFGLPVIA
jgi:hypothetical protein